MQNKNVKVVICPPCGESAGLPTKEGQNKEYTLWSLLPRLTAVLPPQGREITTRGFTLIELLVVVLIIGILAAVAVPQYQKAVEKSRAMQGLTILRSMIEAQKLYYLANNKYATDFNDLDIDIPSGKGASVRGFKEWSFCIDTGSRMYARNWYLDARGAHYTGKYDLYVWMSKPMNIYCTGIDLTVCKALSHGKEQAPAGYGGTWYLVQE